MQTGAHTENRKKKTNTVALSHLSRIPLFYNGLSRISDPLSGYAGDEPS
jgi:hypothetical protein